MSWQCNLNKMPDRVSLLPVPWNERERERNTGDSRSSGERDSSGGGGGGGGGGGKGGGFGERQTLGIRKKHRLGSLLIDW